MRTFICLLSLLMLAACTADPPPPVAAGNGGEAISNRIDLTPQVIDNLGITFARVERRHVAQTLRVPGHFESPPEAARDYHTMLAGRIELLTSQYAEVTVGTPLFTLDSPAWREWQDRLATAEANVATLAARLEIAKAERAAARQAASNWPARLLALESQLQRLDKRADAMQAVSNVWQERVAALEKARAAGAVSADDVLAAKVELAEARAAESEIDADREALKREQAELEAARVTALAELPVFDARAAAAAAEIDLAREAFSRVVNTAAAALGITPDKIAEGAWRGMGKVTVTATAPGRVQHLEVSTGAWVEAGTSVLGTLDLSLVRFRAKALQSDLGLLRHGLDVAIAPPLGGSLEHEAPVRGTLLLGLESRPDTRVLDLLVALDDAPAWARPGVTAEAEIVWDRTAEAQMAIPVRCVVRDGLDLVIFVRDPDDPGKAIRETPPFGPSDGRWIVLYSGVMTGSEVVMDGAYELKLASGDKPIGGGHFHADGTWHAEDH